ncbi:MAG: VOC family protein [Actinomycetota bacterium]|nr:VOC family protein [Actinomycetota bacterium]
MTLDIQITFDCADPGAFADFWAAVLGYQKEPPPKGFDSWDDALKAWGVPEDQWNSRSAIVDPEGKRSRVFFQQVPEGKTAKNRVHLDVRAAPGLAGDERMAALESEAARLVPLGASRFKRFEPGAMEAGFIVMQDPEGNEFCLD